MSEPSQTAVKTLFADSRNLCFFTGCDERLTDPRWKQVNAEIAHIKGEKPTSARYDREQPDTERQSYDNLMLLCPKHHTLVDRLEPDDFPVERLHEIKERHLQSGIAARGWCDDAEAEAFARLAIAFLREQRNPTLIVRSARYGEAETFADVTELVRTSIVDNSLTLAVTNQTMGGDPLENVVKRLEVEWEFDGETRTSSTEEGQTMMLP